MKTKVTDLKACKRQIEVEIPATEVEEKFEEIYKEIRKVAELPGYRMGKAPQDMVEKKYRTKAEEEVLKSLIAVSYEDAIKELKIIPVELPQIFDVKLERKKPFTYKAEVHVKPELKLKNYKGLKINKKKIDIKDTDVEKALSSLQELHAKFISVDGRPIADGDYGICRLVCSSEGKEVFKKEAAWLLVTKEALLKEIYDAIIGMKGNEEKEIPAKLPKDYAEEELAGKDVVFKLKVTEIKEKKLPLLDDEFAKDLGKPNVGSLKEAIKKDLIKRAEIAINEDVRNQLIEQLLKNNSFDVPETMVNRQLESLVNDARERMIAQGIKEKDIDKNVKGVQENLRPRAVNQVKAFFLLNEIAHAEKIKVEPSEVDKTMDVMAAQFKRDKKKLLEEYEKKNLLENLIEQIREEKTIEFLLKEAEIKEGGRK